MIQKYRFIAICSLISALAIFSFIYFLQNNTPQKISVEYDDSSDARKQARITPTPAYLPQPISLDSVFSQDKNWVATLSAQKTTTLISTGDVLLARTVNYKTVTNNDFNWPFENVADLLKQADLTVINLETPLVENCPVTNSGMIFCGDVKNVNGLLFAGVDVVNLANNHMGNWGKRGVDTTVSVLSEAGMLPVGHVNPMYREVNGIRFAFLGYNDIGRQTGVSHIEDDLFDQEIKKAKEQADVVIVMPHWGIEYTHEPSQRQIEIAHRIIDAGADMVLGNHPHWYQPVEVYNNRLIVYSHGNFVFDQMWSDKTREGIVGTYAFYEDSLIDAEFIPMIIEDFGQPRRATENKSKSILHILENESYRLTAR